MTANRILHAIALLSLSAVFIALVSQHAFDMQPCAWCVLQRLIFIVIALVCWLGIGLSRFNASLARVGGLFAAVLAACGVAAAWYQYRVAAQQFSCDMTFADRFMVRTGLDAGLPWVFGIFASCMDARVELLGVEYALWGLALFVAVMVMGLVAATKKPF